MDQDQIVKRLDQKDLKMKLFHAQLAPVVHHHSIVTKGEGVYTRVANVSPLYVSLK
jgi:hypothetical protein